MYFLRRSALVALPQFLLISRVAAGVIGTYELQPDLPKRRQSIARAATTCGGFSGLQQCGADFPSDFCCSVGSSCIRLNTSSTITAAICCPNGSQCTAIQPISCEQSIQNPDLSPASQLHVQPIQQLRSCGSACCPLGYSCSQGRCIAQPTSSTISIIPITTSASSTPTTSGVSLATPYILPNITNESTANSFSGASFAAGFVPGLLIGASLIALALFLFVRRKKRQSTHNEKAAHRDTLTDLWPLERRPTHNRSISEPIANPSVAHRTEFLRSSPPRHAGGSNSDHATQLGDPFQPITPMRMPQIKPLFSHSPFMASTPGSPPSGMSTLPSHLKRGTLSFRISPVRALRKQRSMHSLRRQMADTSRPSDESQRHLRTPGDSSRTPSQDTIDIVMPRSVPSPKTPEQTRRAVRKSSRAEFSSSSPPSSDLRGTSSTASWQTTETTPKDENIITLSPATCSASTVVQRSNRLNGMRSAVDQSPYTPTRPTGAAGREREVDAPTLTVPRLARDRGSTFSVLMEQAGLRKSELMMDGRR